MVSYAGKASLKRTHEERAQESTDSTTPLSSNFLEEIILVTSVPPTVSNEPHSSCFHTSSVTVSSIRNVLYCDYLFLLFKLECRRFVLSKAPKVSTGHVATHTLKRS